MEELEPVLIPFRTAARSGFSGCTWREERRLGFKLSGTGADIGTGSGSHNVRSGGGGAMVVVLVCCAVAGSGAGAGGDGGGGGGGVVVVVVAVVVVVVTTTQRIAS